MSENEWLLLVGIVVPFVIQGIKLMYEKMTGTPVSPKLALNITYVMAIIAAALGKWLSGEVFIPEGDLAEVIPTLVGQVALVLGAATGIYQTLLSKTTGIRS